MYNLNIIDKNGTTYKMNSDFLIDAKDSIQENNVLKIPNKYDEFTYIKNVVFFTQYEPVFKNNYTINVQNQKTNIELNNFPELDIYSSESSIRINTLVDENSKKYDLIYDGKFINYVKEKHNDSKENDINQTINVLKNKDKSHIIFTDGQTLYLENIISIRIFSLEESIIHKSVFLIQTDKYKYYIQNVSFIFFSNNERLNGNLDLVIHQNGGNITIPNIKRTSVKINTVDNIINVNENDINKKDYFILHNEHIDSAYFKPNSEVITIRKIINNKILSI
jgi:hypothetical protein